MNDLTPEKQLRALLGDGYDAAIEKAARALFASEEPDRNDWRWDRPQPNQPNPFAWHAYWLDAAKLALGAALPALLDAAAERDTLRAELAHMTEARDNARAEVDRLTAQIEAAKRIGLGTHLGRTWPGVLNDMLRALDGESDHE